MKKSLNLSLVFVLFLGLFSGSFSVFHINGAYTAYSNNCGGLGVAVESPISIPFFPLYVYYTLPYEKETKISFTQDGNPFASPKANVTTLEAQLGFPFIDIFGWSVGASGVVDILSLKDISGAAKPFPGFAYAGGYAQYKQSIVPMFMDWYAQVGYLVKVADAQEEIKKLVTGLTGDISSIDKSGLYLRAGVSIGF